MLSQEESFYSCSVCRTTEQGGFRGLAASKWVFLILSGLGSLVASFA